ncbi:MAG: ATP-binding protein [Chitinophagaceae bacterium]
MYQNPELYLVTIIGIILGLLLVSFVVAMLVFYKRSQQKQEQEMIRVKNMYEKEVLHSQLEIQENTFKTISQELHDNIGQLLSVVKLSLSSLPLEKEHKAHPLLGHSLQVLSKAIADLSNLTKSLHTDRIGDLGLAESISFELSAIKNTGIYETSFAVSGTEFQLPEKKEIFLFRMFQEILNNIIKHSAATHIIVRLTYGADNTFAMVVEDNGKGFDVESVRASLSSGKGVGLKSMFNRAKMIGADINVESGNNKGTKVTVSVLSE